MNRGKISNNNEESGLDIFIDKINRKIARVLGKKPQKPMNKSTSNKVFTVIILIVLLLLWESTGFYYLSENQAGIVVTNGKITKIVTGMKVGFTLPYPFSDIEIIDTGITDFVQVSKNDTTDYYTTLSKDLLPVNINAKFSYQVINPKLLYLNILQKNDNLDDIVKFHIWQKMHSYIAVATQKEISAKNLTVMSSGIKDAANQDLANLGLEIVKLQIGAINYSGNNIDTKILDNAAPLDTDAIAIPDIATELINQANRYNADKISETRMNIDKFNQLLPQYQKDPASIAMQMYYDMLEKVPLKKDENYTLLNSKLSDILLKKTDAVNIVNNSLDRRDFDRSVDRNRDLNGR